MLARFLSQNNLKLSLLFDLMDLFLRRAGHGLGFVTSKPSSFSWRSRKNQGFDTINLAWKPRNCFLCTKGFLELLQWTESNINYFLLKVKMRYLIILLFHNKAHPQNIHSYSTQLNTTWHNSMSLRFVNYICSQRTSDSQWSRLSPQHCKQRGGKQSRLTGWKLSQLSERQVIAEVSKRINKRRYKLFPS